MILQFPNAETLKLALTSGVAPEPVAAAPTRAGYFGEAIHLAPSAKLKRATLAGLRRLGVVTSRSRESLEHELCCWHQAIPLARQNGEIEVGSKLAVLFELTGDRQLPELVGELLRLGNDRQSFRYLEHQQQSRTLLRVIEPPYYTLLRALQRDDPSAPRAYVEQSPRVWVEIGHRHELGERLRPAAGKLLMLRAPRQWQLIDEAPFRDIYEVVDFQLPASPALWQPRELDARFTIPLRLSPASSHDAAELWILRNGGERQLEQLVESADDQLIRRLAFAVGESDGQTAVALRVRPSQQPPPILVLDGVAFHTYLKLPNLFLPAGFRLHPPLRRDAVAKLLAQDREQITWLYPQPAGSFVAESLPDSAFRPLSDWTDYVLDREHHALQAWVGSHEFEFESFVCRDDQPARDKRPPRQPAEKPFDAGQEKSSQSAGPRDDESNDSEPEQAVDAEHRMAMPSPRKPDEVERRLREVETEFRDNETPPDSAERRALWREMAALNTALEHRHDATVCWSNALWDDPSASDDAFRTWLDCEQRGAPQIEFTEQQFAGLDRDNASQPAEASVFAAYLAWAGRAEAPPAALTAQLPVVARFLERQEPYLPVRTAWLAWTALTEISGGDVLALARARDRLLERLFQHGLRPEFDMPSFLRTGGGADTDRLRALRQHVLHLSEKVNPWIVEPVAGDNPQTRAYCDLVFAYALARVGETTECHRLLNASRKSLAQQDPLHLWLCNAFSQRVNEALEGQPSQNRLDGQLLSQLESMERLDRYKIDRLRNYSYILEPHERIDPYRRWHQRYSDDLSRELAELFDENDRDHVKTRISHLMADIRTGGAIRSRHLRILTTGLELAPRLGETFAGDLLDWVDPVLVAADDVVMRALLLEKALVVAAHFDKHEFVQRLIECFDDELPRIVDIYLSLAIQHSPENKAKIDTIDSLFSQSFRGMRKLGMHNQIGRLYGRLDELLSKPKPSKRKEKRAAKPEPDRVRSLKLKLSVAGGWFYFGQHDRAMPIVDDAASVLMAGDLPPIDQRTLACAYLQAVGRAPVEWALPRIEALFAIQGGRRNLAGIEDSMTTASHFSISQLHVAETTVLTLVSEDFSVGAESRRWLDEDELLVRRRIHADLRAAMQHAGEV